MYSMASSLVDIFESDEVFGEAQKIFIKFGKREPLPPNNIRPVGTGGLGGFSPPNILQLFAL